MIPLLRTQFVSFIVRKMNKNFKYHYLKQSILRRARRIKGLTTQNRGCMMAKLKRKDGDADTSEAQRGRPSAASCPVRMRHSHHSRAGGRHKSARLTRVTASLSETSRWNRALRTLGFRPGDFFISIENTVFNRVTRAYRMRRTVTRRIWSARGLALLGLWCFCRGKAPSKTGL